MSNSGYYGAYTRFVCPDKKDGGYLIGADSLVGDSFDIVFQTDDHGRVKPWVRNRFGRIVGYVNDESAAEQLLLADARGWHSYALLVRILYSDDPKPGRYWGEIAVVSYDNAHKDAFDVFRANVGKKLHDTVRVSVDLGAKGVQSVIASNGAWLPNTREPKPSVQDGTVVVKDTLTVSERLVEAARSNNIGCIIAGWGFIAALILGIALIVKSCVGS